MGPQKQNPGGRLTREFCIKCGFGRFLAWGDLDDDQRLIAERLGPAPEKEPVESHSEIIYCARCLFPRRIEERRA